VPAWAPIWLRTPLHASRQQEDCPPHPRVSTRTGSRLNGTAPPGTVSRLPLLAFGFDSSLALLGVVSLLAAAFVGYLVIDGILGWSRKRRHYRRRE
jgi:hypothetical protein